jgi:cell wall-associated NlpC family hydrolase
MLRRKTLYSGLFVVVSGCASLAPPPDRASASRLPEHTAPRPAPSREHSEALLQAILALGIDYRYGGRSPRSGFDCSGLVAHIYREAWGLELPHNARAQSESGAPVEMHELQAGDLVFYNTLNAPFSHVGVYVGDGRFIHAPKAGAQVRVERVHGSYWTQRFDGARRLSPPSRAQARTTSP